MIAQASMTVNVGKAGLLRDLLLQKIIKIGFVRR
jgi:hypothetical protein